MQQEESSLVVLIILDIALCIIFWFKAALCICKTMLVKQLNRLIPKGLNSRNVNGFTIKGKFMA